MTTKHSGVAKLWLLNLFGNAALVAALYFWLLLPDAHGWQVALSAIAAVVTIFFGLWLRAGSFAYFRLSEFREHAAVWPAFHHAVRNLIALAVWAMPFFALEWCLFWLSKYAPQFGVWLWQKAPFLRIGTPRALSHLSDWLLLLFIWLVAIVWVPAATTVAAKGLKPVSIAHSWRVLKRVRYWGWILLLTIIGLYLPYKLVWWIPDASTLSRQAWSAGIRFFFAYLLLISAWVALLLVAGEQVEDAEKDLLVTKS